MARWRGNFENLTKSLITHLTGLEDGEENFRLCQQFAMSNFKFHRFLDVDSHKVNRALDGMRTKFEVHSQTEKAIALTQLTEEFLNSPIFEDKNDGKTDTHYSILYLLFLLADNPTAADFRLTLPQRENEPVDDFDWSAHLLDGEDVYQGGYADSPIPSDDESLSDSDEDDRPQHQSNEAIVSQSAVVTATHDTSMLVTHESDVVEDNGYGWLMKNLVVQYWKGMSREEDTIDNHFSSNLVRDWESYKSRTNPLYCKGSRTFVTEIQVLREVLWMMSGVSDLFIFQYKGGRFILRDDISVSHLTKECVESFVQPFCKHGVHVQVLQTFVQEIVSRSCLGQDLTTVPMTYQAFTKTVSQFLQDLQTYLSGLEKRIIRNEEVMTLSMMSVELQTWSQKISLVYSLYINGVAAAASLPTNSLKASHLLSVLYNTVLEYDSLGEFTPDMIMLLLPMWMQTSQPYLQIIGDWINNGHLDDPMNEFVVQRNDNVKSVDETFWENAFVLHMPKSSTNSSVLSTTIAQFPEHEQVSVATAWAPKFLQPVVKDIVLTGKSMEVLEHLGQLFQVIGNKDGRPDSLYDTFMKSLEKTLGSKSPTAGISQNRKRETTVSTPVLTPNIEHQMRGLGVFDPLLRINFEAVFSYLHVGPVESDDDRELRLLRGLKSENLQPVEMLLQECLYPHILDRYHVVCSELVRILKEKYCLMDFLTAMRKFFLMEAGDTMFNFYADIFDRMKNMEQWRDLSVLNLVLHEAMYTLYPDEINRLSVTLETPSTQEKFPISVTDCIKLSYAVPWPVDLVITSRSQDIYNQIFSFLLQVKRAKYCLEQLRFFDLKKEDILKSIHLSQYEEEDTTRNTRIHRMQLLRFRLLYFVNSLHNYIMTRILQSTGLEFQSDIEASVDLDQIIAAHNSYVSKIHERCLLHPKVAFLREAVLKVLNLILSFHKIWDQGVDEISMKIIEDMELEFSRCIQFLASFLNNVIKRGSFPHLESLAFALITSMEYKGR
ncbi:gamma-tubulin complex component 5-like isoform X2 [Haliotis asinina]|uniref:gamma-tubulin complex component 5-like isoform X2 n=1 Tax=Haliotis asinina TaxID=109174 RepID=UPI00353200DE